MTDATARITEDAVLDIPDESLRDMGVGDGDEVGFYLAPDPSCDEVVVHVSPETTRADGDANVRRVTGGSVGFPEGILDALGWRGDDVRVHTKEDDGARAATLTRP